MYVKEQSYPLAKLHCVFYDTETTGKNENEDDKIIQLAMMHYGKEGSQIIEDRFEQLFSTTKKIGYGAMATHHITPEMLDNAVKFHQSGAFKILQVLLSSNKYFVAHNAQFDNKMMSQHGLDVTRFICTKKLAQKVMFHDDEVESYGLQYLRYYLGLSFNEEINPHDALSDVIVLEQLFRKLFEMLIDQDIEKHGTTVFGEDYVQKMLAYCWKISTEPTLLRKMPFGKHKGKEFSEIAKTDVQYFNWYLRQDAYDVDIAHSMRTARKELI